MSIVNNENTTNCAINCLILNANQMRIFKRIESHYENSLINSARIELLRLIVMSTAGTDKSYLINIIRERLCKIARNNKIDAQSSILVLAPTGVAAFNICGITIHSVLFILISKNNFDLSGDHLKILQNKLDGIEYLIIDEKLW